MGVREIAAATAAGVITTVAGHPLDTIKVHLQTNQSLRSTWDATKSLVREKALFRGIIPPLCNAVVMNTAMFSMFHAVKEATGGEGLGNALLAGSVSGFVTACISTPTDLIKIQSQLSRGKSTVGVMLSTPLNRLFRGHLANLGREGVFTMVYLGLYDQIHPLGFWQIVAASSLTGGLAWVASYPFDTIKTMVQSSQTKTTYREAVGSMGSVAHLYRGCVASTGRAIMVTSLRMVVYEGVLANWR